MKRKGFMLILVALVCSIRFSLAQVVVEVELTQKQFLPGETLSVAVRVINRSGQTLKLGEGEDWLGFTVENNAGVIMPRTGDLTVAGPFELETAKRATKRVDLAPAFSLMHPDHYKVTATVRLQQWDREVSSAPVEFDVIEGTRLWERDFGLPAEPGSTNATPEVRKYVLQQANYLKGSIRLYVRLTDAAGIKTFKVFPVGTMVSFSRPEPQIDPKGRLHLLYQDGAQTFSYTMISPSGAVLKREKYDYVEGRPRLRPDDGGTIGVVGGRKREEESSDFPAPLVLEFPKDAVRTNQNKP